MGAGRRFERCAGVLAAYLSIFGKMKLHGVLGPYRDGVM